MASICQNKPIEIAQPGMSTLGGESSLPERAALRVPHPTRIRFHEYNHYMHITNSLVEQS